jgi:hypothetical protein
MRNCEILALICKPLWPASLRKRTRKSSLTISAKPVRVEAASQPWILAANDRRADAHRGDGKRFVVRAEEKLSAFVEL